jgi:hypothetical protein
VADQPFLLDSANAWQSGNQSSPRSRLSHRGFTTPSQLPD